MAQTIKLSQQAIAPMATQKRMRMPQHPFAVRYEPYEIRPFYIGIVQPGDTLNEASIVSRVLTDTVKDSFFGWTLEHWYFYCKLSDLDDRDAYREMVVDPDYDASALRMATQSQQTFYMPTLANQTGINYVRNCLKRVVETYFRSENEAWSDHVAAAGRPQAGLLRDTWTQSMVAQSTYDVDDIDVDLDADGTVTASEVEKARALWEMATAHGYTDKSYADWLRSYGIKAPEAEDHTPELLSYNRAFKMPSRVVDPADGSSTNALTWEVDHKITSKKFCREPGFIFGVQTVRPNVLLTNQKLSLTSFFDSGSWWLPGEVMNDPAYGLKSFAAGRGPIDGATAGYVVDINDLLRYGEQFVGYDISTIDTNQVACPANDMSSMHFPDNASIRAMFNASTGWVDARGMVRPKISGRVGKDMTGKTD